MEINATPSLDLSLYNLETGLAELIEYRQSRLMDSETPPTEEEIAALDAEIQRYEIATPKKITGVVGILRYWKRTRETAKAEIDRLKEIIKHYECMEEVIKNRCSAVLERLPEPKKGVSKKLVGVDGSTLSLRTNGGLPPLEITDETLLPSSVRDVVITMPAETWLSFRNQEVFVQRGAEIRYQTNNAKLREALAQPCPTCQGSGEEHSGVCHCGDSMEGYHDNHSAVEMVRQCETCGGTGKNAIPGAHLLPRGDHVEVR